MRPAPVFRLRPRNQRQIEQLQGTLDLGGWSEATRVELNERLTQRRPNETDPWRYAMVAAHADKVGRFLKEIKSGPRPFATLAVWYALGPYVRRDTGEVLCTQRTLATTASVSIGDVQRAMVRLVEIGAIIREERGQYRVHPSLMWKGELAKRETTEANTPRMRLLEHAE